MLYVIEDDNGGIARIRTKMFGVNADVLAIFAEEQAALDVLFQIVERYHRRWRVTPMGDRIVMDSPAHKIPD